MSFTRKQRPITVAILQCSTVGVKVTLMQSKCESMKLCFLNNPELWHPQTRTPRKMTTYLT
jgi:hypothetical protein